MALTGKDYPTAAVRIGVGHTSTRSVNEIVSQKKVQMDTWLVASNLSESQLDQLLRPEEFEAAQILKSTENCIRRSFIKVCVAHWFTYLCAAVITIYFIVLGIEADDWVRRAKNGQAGEAFPFAIIDVSFLVFFNLEIVVRLLGRANPVLDDYVLLLDMAVTAAMALDVCVIRRAASEWHFGFNVFICLRWVRLLRVLKLMSSQGHLGPLNLMAAGILYGFPSLFCTLLVMILALMIFAVPLVTLVAPAYYGDNSFCSVMGAITGGASDCINKSPWDGPLTFTIYGIETMLGGDLWASSLIPWLRCDSFRCSLGIVIFVCFVVICHVFIMSLATGIFIELMFASKKASDDFREYRSVWEGTLGITNLKKVLTEMDSDGDNMLSWEDFKAGLSRNQDVLELFNFDLHMAESIYRVLDTRDGCANNAVAIEEFLFEIMKAATHSSSMDLLIVDHQQQKATTSIAALGYSCKTELQWAATELDDQEMQMEELAKHVAVLGQSLEQRMNSSKERLNIDELHNYSAFAGGAADQTAEAAKDGDASKKSLLGVGSGDIVDDGAMHSVVAEAAAEAPCATEAVKQPAMKPLALPATPQQPETHETHDEGSIVGDLFGDEGDPSLSAGSLDSGLSQIQGPAGHLHMGASKRQDKCLDDNFQVIEDALARVSDLPHYRLNVGGHDSWSQLCGMMDARGASLIRNELSGALAGDSWINVKRRQSNTPFRRPGGADMDIQHKHGKALGKVLDPHSRHVVPKARKTVLVMDEIQGGPLSPMEERSSPATAPQLQPTLIGSSFVPVNDNEAKWWSQVPPTHT